MKKIMILGASVLQLPAIEKAKEMGLDVVAVDMDPNAIGFSVKGITKEVISTIDIPKVVHAAKKHMIDGIMTLASDLPMRTVATVAKELNLISISQDAALKATNKVEMRNALASYGVPIPKYFKVSNQDELFNAVKILEKENLKCIMKPADNSGSRGIKLLEDYDENSVIDAYMYSKEYSRSGDILVEEFMEGPEVSVETLTIDGICHVIQITDKVTTGSPHFVEMGHSQPSSLDVDIQKEIKSITVAANKAIGITTGPSHTEIKVTKNGPKVVEIGARLGGDCITTHLVPLSTGVNMVEACIKIALGETISIERTLDRAAAIRYFEQKNGIIKEINGLNEAQNITGVRLINFMYKEGDLISDIDSSSSRVGFVISEAREVQSAVEVCEEVKRNIKIKIKCCKI